ncbi:MAG TPA: hypothetical protein DIC53_03485 [Synergistaceae bacterium]|nr:hypothetical protein [Synergistaceae bacterium]
MCLKQGDAMATKLWITLYRSFLGIYVPEELRALRGEVLLHLSDTPSSMYGGLQKLLALLEPRWVVLTGDLADDIKLEIRPGLLPVYREKMKALADVLSSVPACRSVIVTGNHDDERVVRTSFPKAVVLNRKGRCDADGLELNLSHDFGGLERPYGPLNLFGHNVTRSDFTEGGRRFLNGLVALHAVHIPTGRVFSLPYPKYVNDDRMLRRKTGL